MTKFRYRGNTVELQQAARELRKTQTSAEEVLWQALRDRQLHGIKFRRQYAVQRFILDFYCPAARLVIELDGSVHDEQLQRERDAARTEMLEAPVPRDPLSQRGGAPGSAVRPGAHRSCGGAGILMKFSPSPAQFAGEGAGG